MPIHDITVLTCDIGIVFRMDEIQVIVTSCLRFFSQPNEIGDAIFAHPSTGQEGVEKVQQVWHLGYGRQDSMSLLMRYVAVKVATSKKLAEIT